MRGLLTLLWHGPRDARDVVRHVRRRDGRPARPGRRPLPRRSAASSPTTHGIATMRVGYRKPNDLSRCVHDVAAAADLASRSGARGFVVIGHSFGGAVAVQAGTVLGAHCRGRRHARRPSRPGASTRRSSATRRCSCCTAPTTRSCPRRRARSCRCSPVTARSCCSPAPATCSPRPRPRSASACSTWIPERFADGTATVRPSSGAGELGDDRGELVDVVVADDDVRQAPLLAAAVQLLGDLVLGADERRARLERLLGRARRTTAPAPRRASCGRARTLVTKKRIWISMSSMRAPAASRIHCTLRSVCSRSESLAASSPISPARRFGLMPTMSASRAAIDSTRLPPPPISSGGPGCLHRLRATTRSR